MSQQPLGILGAVHTCRELLTLRVCPALATTLYCEPLNFTVLHKRRAKIKKCRVETLTWQLFMLSFEICFWTFHNLSLTFALNVRKTIITLVMKRNTFLCMTELPRVAEKYRKHRNNTTKLPKAQELLQEENKITPQYVD